MMEINSDQAGYLASALKWAGGAMATIVAVGWRHTHAKIKALDDKKAEREVVDNMHKEITSIWQHHDKLLERMDEMINQNHTRHCELLSELGEINGKLSIVKDFNFQRPK